MTWLVLAKDIVIVASAYFIGRVVLPVVARRMSWTHWAQRPRRLDIVLFGLALAGLWLAADLRLIGGWPTLVATVVAVVVFAVAGRVDARDAGPQRRPEAR